MLKFDKIKPIVFSGLAIILAIMILSTSASAGQVDPFSEIKEKLSGISEKEKEILQNLFTLAQEMELMEAEEKELALGIDTVNQEIKNLETAIAEGELVYEKKHRSLEQVLKSYQRMGPGSYVDIILDSDNLGTFLQRVNILQDLTRNTGELLDQLEASGEKLSKEKAALSEKLALIKEKQEQLKGALAKKMKLKSEAENYLVSLKGEEEQYREQLAGIQQMWGELKPLFADAAKEFSRIIEEGSLPADALKITFSFFGIKGAIEDKVINEVVSKQSKLPEMTFAFHQGKVEISLPEKQLVLLGTFIILEGHILKFQAQEGSFFGMPLTPGSIEELFSEGDLVLNLEPLLAGNIVHSVEIKEGYLELVNKLDLF
ncbi:MAG: coiled-coil domain-containing protein [Clostridia bacterium]